VNGRIAQIVLIIEMIIFKRLNRKTIPRITITVFIGRRYPAIRINEKKELNTSGLTSHEISGSKERSPRIQSNNKIKMIL